MEGPQGWVIAPTAADWSNAPDADQAAATAMAVHTLWTLTGRVLGTFPAVVRPCFGSPQQRRKYFSSGHRSEHWWPGLVAGTGAAGSCGCSNACECIGPNQTMLPGPVAAVTDVRIDGQVVPPSAYRVKNGRWLLRVDGQSWPQDQDLTAPDDGVGAFVVRYDRSLQVPAAGLVAAADLAVELVRARLDKPCKVPQRAQSVSRQGVDVQLIDPYELFSQGLTGIPSVDRWVAAVNPNRNRSRSRVYSPDAPRVTRIR